MSDTQILDLDQEDVERPKVQLNGEIYRLKILDDMVHQEVQQLQAPSPGIDKLTEKLKILFYDPIDTEIIEAMSFGKQQRLLAFFTATTREYLLSQGLTEADLEAMRQKILQDEQTGQE